MDIDFTGEYSVNNDGVTFYAIADDQRVTCVVSKKALNEIANPDDEDTETLFLEHQYKFEEIAEGMILNHQVVEGEIHITHGELS